jgi:excinuclease ABC subunit C
VYGERVRQARDFLQGIDVSPIERLQVQMQGASDALQFERAAALRDKVQRLEALRDQFDRLRFAVESLTFAYRVPGHAGDDRVYLVRRGVVRAERSAPRSVAEEEDLRALGERVAAATEYRGSTAVPAHEVDELLIVSSWFANRPEEIERTAALH